MREDLIMPNPEDPRLSRAVSGIDHRGQPVEPAVPEERPLTIYLNGQEIVTVMAIGDYPEYLALGYLINQNMLTDDDQVTAVEYEQDMDTVPSECAHLQRKGSRESND